MKNLILLRTTGTLFLFLLIWQTVNTIPTCSLNTESARRLIRALNVSMLQTTDLISLIDHSLREWCPGRPEYVCNHQLWTTVQTSTTHQDLSVPALVCYLRDTANLLNAYSDAFSRSRNLMNMRQVYFNGINNRAQSISSGLEPVFLDRCGIQCNSHTQQQLTYRNEQGHLERLKMFKQQLINIKNGLRDKIIALSSET